ncbi:TRL domain-containing protein [Leptospira sp. 'Mane']|uniref:TRL domain-containing protein n=1 Tax=Leptospira sp. 'Mane' TaxID=3387407 RepID=UPI00398AC0FD
MKKVYLILLFVLFGAMTFNCASAGGDYTISSGSLFSSVTLNKDISTAAELNTKTGEACAMSFLSLIAVGDASAKAAAVQGNIKVVKAVDYSTTNFIYGLVFRSLCTIVRGE